MLRTYIISLLAILVFSACAVTPTPTDTTPSVVVSTIPLYSLTTSLVGNSYDVHLLVPAGASVHTWSPKPSDIRELHEADVVILNGVVDAQILGLLQEENTQKVINMTESLEAKGLLQHEEESEDEHDADHEEDHHDNNHDEEEEEEAEHAHAHEGRNPHYWLSPELVDAQLAILVEQFGPSTEANANNFKQRLEERLQLVRDQLAGTTPKVFIDFHDAYGYFYHELALEDYHMGSLEPFPGKEPSAQYIKDLYTLVEEHNVTILFTEPQLTSNFIARLQEKDVATYIMNPLGEEASPDALLDIYTALGNTLFTAFSS